MTLAFAWHWWYGYFVLFPLILAFLGWPVWMLMHPITTEEVKAAEEAGSGQSGESPSAEPRA